MEEEGRRMNLQRDLREGCSAEGKGEEEGKGSALKLLLWQTRRHPVVQGEGSGAILSRSLSSGAARATITDRGTLRLAPSSQLHRATPKSSPKGARVFRILLFDQPAQTSI